MNEKTVKVCNQYVILAVILSSGLNAQANLLHVTPDVTLNSIVSTAMALILGVSVPILAMLGGKSSGLLYRMSLQKTKEQRKFFVLCLLSAVGTVAILLLSVSHCTQAIVHLTGSGETMLGYIQSGLLAVGIDYGLIISEVIASIVKSEAHVEKPAAEKVAKKLRGKQNLVKLNAA
jgi:hypothetical protein